MSEIDKMIQASKLSAAGRGSGGYQAPPSRRLAIVTCMDARFFPSRVLGLKEGDAHVIRNAGGRTSEALRSLVISQRLLGTNAIAVIAHTDCGMTKFTNEDLDTKVQEELGADSSEIDFLPFSNLHQTVREDVELLRDSPLIAEDTEIRGFVYDVESRELTEVV
jgi:carbonic anhydrase